MHGKKDAYGHCPKCQHAGWHKYKGKALIYGEDSKYKVSLYKCPKCGKKFGFALNTDKGAKKDDWKKVTEMLYDLHDNYISTSHSNWSMETANKIVSIIQVCEEHC